MTGFDITDSLAPASDQLDAIELVAGPRIFTVERVSKGSVEQPVQIHLEEFPRVWRPSKGMRRVLAACWGTEASEWAGRRVELYFDPDVTFGKETPGGTRIARLSHIDKQKKIPLLVSRGKSATYVVEPLSATAAPAASDTAESVAATTPVAAEPAAANGGGLQINSPDDALRVIRAMTNDQVKALRTLLESDATSKTALAAELYEKRAGDYAEGVHLELAGMDDAIVEAS